MSYVALEQLRAHAQISDTADDTMLEAAADAATEQVDEFCRRRFTAVGGTRRYRVRRPTRLLYVDDLTEVQTVEVDGVAWPDSEWELWPYNAAADGRPYTALEVETRRLFRGMVEVSGTFGWPEIPAAVVQATLLQASRLAQRRNAAFGIAQVPGYDGSTGMRLLSKLDADVELLLQPYRRRPVMVG